MRRGAPGALVSHGMCVSCSGSNGFFPIDYSSGSPQQELPSGTLLLDCEGRVREYSWDPPEPAGRSWQWIKGCDFFGEVAPWSPVRHFRAQHQLMVDAARDQEAELAFSLANGGVGAAGPGQHPSSPGGKGNAGPHRTVAGEQRVTARPGGDASHPIFHSVSPPPHSPSFLSRIGKGFASPGRGFLRAGGPRRKTKHMLNPGNHDRNR